jgi:hypothetical protein
MVGAELARQPGQERHGSGAGGRLHRHDGAVRAELAGDSDRRSGEVDVAPTEPERLGGAQAGECADERDRPERVRQPGDYAAEFLG